MMKITGILKAQEVEGNDVLLDFECQSNSESKLRLLVNNNQYEKFFAHSAQLNSTWLLTLDEVIIKELNCIIFKLKEAKEINSMVYLSKGDYFEAIDKLKSENQKLRGEVESAKKVQDKLQKKLRVLESDKAKQPTEPGKDFLENSNDQQESEPPIKLRNVKKGDNETEASMNDIVSQYKPESDDDPDSTININNYDITVPEKGDFQLKKPTATKTAPEEETVDLGDSSQIDESYQQAEQAKGHNDTDQPADDIDINDYFGGRDDDEGLGL
ncbi:hypothetical protein CBG24_08805 [Limosilactobacillus reuteri]|uniref:Uncharacterized protein n=2 Tax=Limosilactobacillus reuteri TaxID=1598 RepID=A0AB73PDM1_LIMRT|nr:hypothetical protein [Limosilactobacillus reuteri]OYS91687.1 hypothetical protein CBG18_02310 [Limosilactobacillus reuteri]OYS91995.1 hypothetical protein CBG15_10105 [Limosilactobacillus reuteri]OYS93677.1 hypothetical protein CBG10_07805 [Limosilactobacillus reuteri]OYS93975.1 hypothetical protein CBG13_10155 [Limosilactobacillus reuteri]OYS97576.1 hypothetical protein CBG22_09635 [Limosilactobacillus reuteri]